MFAPISDQAHGPALLERRVGTPVAEWSELVLRSDAVGRGVRRLRTRGARLEISKTQGVWIALGISLAYAALHWFGPRIRAMAFKHGSLHSFGGGIAAAYVFLYLLPNLARGNEAVGNVLDDVLRPTPLVDLGIFVVALAGFVGFYWLEWLARRRPGEEEARGSVFAVHAFGFAVYNAFVVYTTPTKLQTGLGAALLFTVAMALHFLMTDQVFEEHFPQRSTGWGPVPLVAGPVAGWVAVALFGPTSTLLVTLMTAFLGGAILLNVFSRELTPRRESNFGWFSMGLGLYASLITALTYYSKPEAA